MSDIDVVELEGQHFVKITMNGESVRAEAGALSYMTGDIEVFAPIPSPWRAIANLLSSEPVIRPRYQGSGEIVLESTPGGYHIIELDGEAWILEKGAYWASEGGVELGLFRESAITSFWADDDLINFRTKVSGKGKVVLNTRGPVEEVCLQGSKVAVEGRLVIARTVGLDYTVRRPTRSLFGYYLSGEKMVRSYSGTGRLLICTTSYMNERLINAVESRTAA
jgi:uncharacterized protein (AIM24 family)